MMTTRRLLLSCLVLPAFVAAQESVVKVEGQPFERRVVIAGTPLQLNGTGIRGVAWFKAFAVGLYLSGGAHTADQVVATPGPKRLQLRVLTTLPAVEFAKAFRKGVSRNAGGPDPAARLEQRIGQFEAMVNKSDEVQRGDVIDLDFDPARGTLFAINGKSQGGAIAGDDFYAALLRAFVGDKPYDPKLKAGLLGQRS